MKLLNKLNNRWFKFGIWATLYLLWVIWFNNYWFIIGIGVIFDMFITQKVKWAFWKKKYKKGEKRNSWLEWLDAIIFALIVSTFIKAFFFESYMIPTSSMERSLLIGDYLFVSKFKYGPRVSETPLALPLVHNRIPSLNTETYLEWIKNPYRRMAGLREIKRDDIVVFSFPHGDTVLSKIPEADYYTYVRMYGREYTIQTHGPIIVRPDDRKDNYVKRCVAISGDTLQIINGDVVVNGIKQKNHPGIQNSYTVYTNGTQINPKILDKMSINPNEVNYDSSLPGYTYLPLNVNELAEIEALGNVVEIRKNVDIYPPDFPDMDINLFPFSTDYKWTRDNYGPLWIPSKGSKVELTLENLPIYRRIIDVYEGNDLEVKDGEIFINSQKSSSYTFKMNYYFMMGDNRHNSLDSRYWGFVPESHVVGSPVMIWFSNSDYKSFPSNIRWKRIFKLV